MKINLNKHPSYLVFIELLSVDINANTGLAMIAENSELKELLLFDNFSISTGQIIYQLHSIP